MTVATVSSTGNAKNDFTASINSSTWTIVSIVFNKTGNQIFGRLNGTTRTSIDTYNSSMNTNVHDVRMMRNRSNQKLNGRMAEYFHVAGVPGTGGTDITDVEKAEGYLAHKWGLESNLSNSHHIRCPHHPINIINKVGEYKVMYWLFILTLKSILSSIIGSSFHQWFKNTKVGVWVQRHLDNPMAWIAQRYDIEIPSREDKWLQQYPKTSRQNS